MRPGLFELFYRWFQLRQSVGSTDISNQDEIGTVRMADGFICEVFSGDEEPVDGLVFFSERVNRDP